jgi:intein/homing endonuclease
MTNLTSTRILKISKGKKEKVFDIQVENAHHYLLKDGTISHNSIGGYFPTNVQSGGCMIPGTLIQTPKGLVKIEDIKSGDFVLTMDGEKEVTHTWTFDDSGDSDGSMKKTWEIEFEDGVTYQVSEDHRFLVNENWKEDSSWKKVWELSEDDEVIMVKSNV